MCKMYLHIKLLQMYLYTNVKVFIWLQIYYIYAYVSMFEIVKILSNATFFK